MLSFLVLMSEEHGLLKDTVFRIRKRKSMTRSSVILFFFFVVTSLCTTLSLLKIAG